VCDVPHWYFMKAPTFHDAPTRTCSFCFEEKPASEFPKKKQPHCCVTCKREQEAEYRKKKALAKAKEPPKPKSTWAGEVRQAKAGLFDPIPVRHSFRKQA